MQEILSASSASQATDEVLERNKQELMDKLRDAISAGISQGSKKSSFYPRNATEAAMAVGILTRYGYDVEHILAKDQRDRDCITINWEPK